MMAALLPAILSVCFAASPGAAIQCNTSQMQLERKACGTHWRAELPLNGQWVRADARVACSKK